MLFLYMTFDIELFRTTRPKHLLVFLCHKPLFIILCQIIFVNCIYCLCVQAPLCVCVCAHTVPTYLELSCNTIYNIIICGLFFDASDRMKEIQLNLNIIKIKMILKGLLFHWSFKIYKGQIAWVTVSNIFYSIWRMYCNWIGNGTDAWDKCGTSYSRVQF